MATSISRRRFAQLMAASVVGGAVGSWGTAELLGTQLTDPAAPDTGHVQVRPRSITTATGLRVHAIQTGFVAVKTAHRVLSGPESTRLLSIMLDRHWTGWMPIFTWVIEHPEGVIVVDTGETSRVNLPDYTNCDPVTSLIYRSALRFAVHAADEIGPQLDTLGIPPAQVRWVVQTHLHSDHMGGLAYFPQATTLVGQLDYPQSAGALACRYPPGFAPQFPQFTAEPLAGFATSYPLTQAGDVWILPTPGHSLGHQSVVLDAGDRWMVFAGDVVFDQAQLVQGTLAGIVADVPQARQTLTALRQLIQSRPTVFLPTHDPESSQRFEELAVLRV